MAKSKGRIEFTTKQLMALWKLLQDKKNEKGLDDDEALAQGLIVAALYRMN